jgi:DNA repair exonuclease SbcCD ATPase subunit
MSSEQAQAQVLAELHEIRRCINNLDSKIVDTKSSLDSKITDTKELLQNEIHSIRNELLEFQLKAQQLDDVSNWSTQFREQITIAELERIRQDVASLKEYKAKSTVVFAVAQIVMAGVIAYLTK